MAPPPMTFHLPSEDDTTAFGVALASVLKVGDTLLLQGEIGSGKSTLSRAIIRALADNPAEEVPSPTYTLVQTYETPRGEVWHADLYRLTTPEEALELGLTEAFDQAICLIEWPDRLEDLRPRDALTVRLAPEGTSRSILLDGGLSWAGRLANISDDVADA